MIPPVRPYSGGPAGAPECRLSMTHKRWVIVLAVLVTLLLLLAVFFSHDPERSIPKSLIIHGK